MTTTNDSLRLAELLKTPICKMDGEELAFLITNITSNQQAQVLLTQKPKEEHNVYGIAGIAQIFGCSIPTASRIKKSGIPFNPTVESTTDFSLPPDQRPPGGLGIMFLHQMTETLDYQRDGHLNVLTLYKNI